MRTSLSRPIAELATPAGALGDAGKERHQRRLQRIGQQDRLVVLAGQGFADAPTGRQIQRAVAEREAQGLAHFGHALEDRPAPLGGQHVDLALGVALLETLNSVCAITMSPTQLGPTIRIFMWFP